MHSASCGAGRLTELCRDEGGGLTVTDAYRQVVCPANHQHAELLQSFMYMSVHLR